MSYQLQNIAYMHCQILVVWGPHVTVFRDSPPITALCTGIQVFTYEANIKGQETEKKVNLQYT